jgi:hypothetical protein
MSPHLARRIAAFNQRVTNPLLGPLVWYLPRFGRVEHLGRRSGRLHRAPMMAFRSPDGRTLTFALTYGPEANWVRNGLAADRVDFVSRWSGRVTLTDLRIVHDPAPRTIPPWIARVLRLLRVRDFLEGTIVAAGSRPARTAGRPLLTDVRR